MVTDIGRAPAMSDGLCWADRRDLRLQSAARATGLLRPGLERRGSVTLFELNRSRAETEIAARHTSSNPHRLRARGIE